jgi:hypothetical protein
LVYIFISMAQNLNNMVNMIVIWYDIEKNDYMLVVYYDF